MRELRERGLYRLPDGGEFVASIEARGGGFEGFCHAGEREFVLTEDGVVYGCELIGTPLGNVRDSGYDFSKIREREAVARHRGHALSLLELHLNHLQGFLER